MTAPNATTLALQEAEKALEPLAALPIGSEFDMSSEEALTVLYHNSGRCITLYDIRQARITLASIRAALAGSETAPEVDDAMVERAMSAYLGGADPSDFGRASHFRECMRAALLSAIGSGKAAGGGWHCIGSYDPSKDPDIVLVEYENGHVTAAEYSERCEGGPDDHKIWEPHIAPKVGSEFKFDWWPVRWMQLPAGTAAPDDGAERA